MNKCTLTLTLILCSRFQNMFTFLISDFSQNIYMRLPGLVLVTLSINEQTLAKYPHRANHCSQGVCRSFLRGPAHKGLTVATGGPYKNIRQTGKAPNGGYKPLVFKLCPSFSRTVVLREWNDFALWQKGGHLAQSGDGFGSLNFGGEGR